MADLTRRWIWLERLLFAGSFLLLLSAVAVLGINSSSLPARWAEEALVAAFPGVGVNLGSVRLTGPGSLEATALRVDLDADGRPDFRSDRVAIRFGLFRWLRQGDPLGAVTAVTVRGVHMRLVLPEETPPATGSGSSGAVRDTGRGDPGLLSRELLDRLPRGIELRVEEADLTLADAAGEIIRLVGEGEVIRTAGQDGDAFQVSLAVEEPSGARLAAAVQVPVTPAGPWRGEVHAATDLAAPWLERLLGRLQGWPREVRAAGPLGVNGALSGRGTLPNVTIELEGAPMDLETGWSRYRFDQIVARLTWGTNGLRLDSLRAEDGPAVITASGSLSMAGPELDVRAERLALARYVPFLQEYLEGEAGLLGRVSGPWSDLRLEGSVTALHPTLLGGEVERLEADLAWAGGALQVIKARAVSGDGSLAGTGWWRPGAPAGGIVEADVHADDFAIQTFPLARRMGLGGQVDGAVRLEGALADPAVTGQILSQRLLVGPAAFTNVEGVFGGSWQRLHVERLTAQRVDGGSYQISGWIGAGVDGAHPEQGPGLQLHVEATGESLPDVAALLGYQLPSYLLTGRFDGRAQVGGNTSNPTGSARLELKDSPLLGEELVTQLDLRFGDGSVRVERLRRHPLRTGLDTWNPTSDRV